MLCGFQSLAIAAPWRLDVAVAHGRDPEDEEGHCEAADGTGAYVNVAQQPSGGDLEGVGKRSKKIHVDRIIDQC
jgi:hypothetical protein